MWAGSSKFSADMFDPVLVAVDLTPNRREEGLLDGPGDGTGFADLAVVDRADGHHLGGRAAEKGLLARVEVTAEDVGDLGLVAEVAGDGHDRILGDPLQGPGACRRRE